MTLEEIREDIDLGNSNWTAAWYNQDASGLAALFHPEGAMLGEEGKVYKGRKAIEENMQVIMNNMGSALFDIVTEEVYVVGDDIYEKGRYTLSSDSIAAKMGRYVVVWRYMDDGVLYFYRDISVD